MKDTPTRPQHLFIVRLWSDAAPEGPEQWRGSVEHVATGHKLYFTSLRDLNDFMVLHLAVPVPVAFKEKESE